ncbi:18605_t:CDS:1, partial [Gigaspora rosea]
KPNFSGDTLNTYDYYTKSEQMKGQLDFEPFPNLSKITFGSNVRLNILESINISKNDKLNKIVIFGENYNFFEDNSFMLLIKETKLNRVIVSYSQ